MAESQSPPICSNIVTDSDSSVTKENVPSLSLRVVSVLQSDPTRVWCPQEITRILHANPASVRQICKRLASFGKCSGPVIRVNHGWYQYHAEKNGRLSTMISQLGRVGIENIVYVSKGTRSPSCQLKDQKNVTDNRDKSRASKPGYPRCLPTGQEIRWEVETNGSERLSLVSNGNPFSIDLVLYLHDELIRKEGLKADEWERVSIEINRDTQRLILNPECITLQDNYGILLKAYNRGQQARYEVADRTRGSMKDTLSLFLTVNDTVYGKAAFKTVSALEERMIRSEKKSERALMVAMTARDSHR